MKIDAVDFFYAAMPEVTLDADGSQDALLVRVVDDAGHVGWGECEASPLASIAAFVAPRSHGVCQPVSASVLGESLDDVADIARISQLVERNSMDLLQASHTFSGIEMALWDLLGRRLEEPVWRLLGHTQSLPRTPYASVLFGTTPNETFAQVKEAIGQGFHAVKLGWADFGTGDVADDELHLGAAREALGSEGTLFIDAGQIFGDDVAAAAARLPALSAAGADWLEEPFSPQNFAAHSALARIASGYGVRIAGGEGAHSAQMAINLIDYGDVDVVQIDTGRIGGIGPASTVAQYALESGVHYLNHTFTTHLALSASLQPFAGMPGRFCEYPAEPSTLARSVVTEPLPFDADGALRAPDAPGLGVEVNLERIAPYLRAVEITVDGQALYAGSQTQSV